MNIVAVKEVFSVKNHFHLPKHSDITMRSFSECVNDKSIDAFLQTNIVCKFKAHTLHPYYKWISNSNKPYLVMEQSVFRKGVDIKDPKKSFFRLGLYSYTYDVGFFNNKNSPPDRWKKIKERCNIEIKPWKSVGDYILILLQNPEDSSLNNLDINYSQWIKKIILTISTKTHEDIVVRLHPRFIRKYQKEIIPVINKISVPNKITIRSTPNSDLSSGGKDFEEDLRGARAVVSFSSNGLQEAVCEGIPAISMDKSSFAWPVSYHSLDILSEKNIKCKFERDQWLYDCAYCQWTPDELDSGYPHQRLLEKKK